MLLSFQTDFNLISVVVCAILEGISSFEPVGPVLGHHTSKERQLAAVPELPSNQSEQPPRQSHVVDYIEQIKVASVEDHC